MLIRHPVMNRTRPAWIAGRRPTRSESGPKTSWPMPSPTNSAVMTNWTSFRRATPRSSTDRGQRRQHRVDRERHERHQEGGEWNELADPEMAGRTAAPGSASTAAGVPVGAGHGKSGLKSRSKPKARGPTSASPASVRSALGESSAITRTRWP